MQTAHSSQNKAGAISVTGTHTVIQGEFATSSDPKCSLNTVLGSCVSVCLFDPLARIGGMNHFLLPEARGSSMDEMIFGLHSMELLINNLLKARATRSHLKAKLFGGASMIKGLSNIGARNVEFAHRFLKDEGFEILSEDTGGRRGRRLRFWPTSGRVQLRYMQVAEAEEIPEPKRAPVATHHVDIELF